MTRANLIRISGIAIAGIFLVIDRYTKTAAMAGFEHRAWWGNFHIFKNQGVLFSIPLPAWLSIGLVIAICLVLSWGMIRAWRRQQLWHVLGPLFIIVGAVSNVTDRWRFGYVVDWADLGRWFPIFNIADITIVLGILLLLLARRIDKPSAISVQ